MSAVGYYTEEKDWGHGLSKCRSLPTLRAFVISWMPYVPDALAVLGAMSERDFAEWRKGLAIERKGSFAGRKWAGRYGALLLPEKLLWASVIAEEYSAPMGTVLIRMAESVA